MGKRSCETCIFLMPDGKERLVCAGRKDFYGKPYEDIPGKIRNNCNEYEMCLTELIEQETKKQKEAAYNI